MLNVKGSMSTNTGSAPARETAVAVEMNEMAGTITSSPGPIPSTARAVSSVTVPFTALIPCAQCWKAANSPSSRPTISLNPPHCALPSTSRSSSISRSVWMGQAGMRIVFQCS